MFDLSLRHADIDHRWRNAARVAIQRGGGRDWWWTANLVRKCLESWTYVNGFLRLEGIRAEDTSFPDFLDAAYVLMWRNADESERQKLDLELKLMPKGVRSIPNTEQSRQMALAFAAD